MSEPVGLQGDEPKNRSHLVIAVVLELELVILCMHYCCQKERHFQTMKNGLIDLSAVWFAADTPLVARIGNQCLS